MSQKPKTAGLGMLELPITELKPGIPQSAFLTICLSLVSMKEFTELERRQIGAQITFQNYTLAKLDCVSLYGMNHSTGNYKQTVALTA